MDLGLHNKTVFITGASSGIGAAAARLFAAEGADVVVSYGKNKEGAEFTAHDIEQTGRRAWLCPMDISNPRRSAASHPKPPGWTRWSCARG